MASEQAATVRLNGRILTVGGGKIEIDVTPSGGPPCRMVLPVQRGQEEWAGARLYKHVNISIEIKSEGA